MSDAQDPGRYEGAPTPQPYSRQGTPGGRGTLDPSRAYTQWIWILSILPIAHLLLTLTYRPDFAYRSIGGTRTVDPTSVFTPAYILLLLGAVVINAALIALAYLDSRELRRRGLDRPWPWPWAFLTLVTPLALLVYAIGRAVIVRRASGRGLGPVWVLAAVLAISFVGGLINALSYVTQMLQQLPGYSS